MSCVTKYFLLFVLNLLPDNFMECLLVLEQKEAVTDCPQPPSPDCSELLYIGPITATQMSPVEAKKPLSI